VAIPPRCGEGLEMDVWVVYIYIAALGEAGGSGKDRMGWRG
jgi:hypothetical protein